MRSSEWARYSEEEIFSLVMERYCNSVEFDLNQGWDAITDATDAFLSAEVWESIFVNISRDFQDVDFMGSTSQSNLMGFHCTTQESQRSTNADFTDPLPENRFRRMGFELPPQAVLAS